jgi:UDP-N-acetylmuramate dehydrogenase
MLILPTDFLEKIEQFKPKFEEKLANYTTWKIGGPAKVLIVTENSEQLEVLVLLCLQFDLPYLILGNGSNILVSDNGIDKVVIINKSRNLEIISNFELNSALVPKIEARHGKNDTSLYSFNDLDFEEAGQATFVSIDSGVMLSYAINWCLKNSLSGLQWFSGIPGTIGGSLFNNIHGGNKHFSDYLVGAVLLENGVKKEVGANFFEFGYDQSLLRKRQDLVILKVVFQLVKVSEELLEKSKFANTEWLRRKSVQPKISCGSVFKSISKEDQLRLGYPTQGMGYLTEHILGLKGLQVGGAQVSLKHANFIENLGSATSQDVLTIMKKITLEAENKTGIQIHPEINFLGFEPEELTGLHLE